ncbi:MAG: threonine ammonia-lyase, partial [SAR202 cluster bacterium]|nr:threonine ammonia-lyase [SAR202 cluster bacterium]
GVIAASAGNHAQGVALAARMLGSGMGFPEGIPCTIVMPRGAPLAKLQATRGYRALVKLHGETFDEALAEAQRIGEADGKTFAHAFDDETVIAGHGTVGLEVAEDLPGAELVVVPVGGGGLIAGVATALAAHPPSARVVGVQIEAATGARDSLRQGRRVGVTPRPTIADGIAVGRPGALTLPIMQGLVHDIVTVSDEETSHAILVLLERAKLLVEGAGAVGVAALLSGRVEAAGKRVVVVLSGGNIDTNVIARTLQHGMAHAGRYLALRVVIPDRPGGLAALLRVVADAGANVLEVSHDRYRPDMMLDEVTVELTLEARDAAHEQVVSETLRERGYRR